MLHKQPNLIHGNNTIRYWHGKIGYFESSVSIADLEKHLHDMGIEAITVQDLKYKSSAPLAMYIVVPYEAKDKIMCNDF